jgi:hypothetical protein
MPDGTSPSDFGLIHVSRTQPVADHEHERGNWFAENILKPMAHGTGAVQVTNTLIDVANTGLKAVGKDEIGKIAPVEYEQAQFGSANWLAQTGAGGVGAIVPYVIAGKATGGLLRAGGEAAIANGIELNAGTMRLLASEKTATILGAGLYEGLKEPGQGESRLANAAGTMAGFAVFEFAPGMIGKAMPGLASMNISALSKTVPVGLGFNRIATGMAGGTVSYLTSHELAGQSIDGKELMQSAITGGVMNVALPALQETLAKPIDAFNNRIGRGVPVQRWLSNQGQENTLLNELGAQVPLARVVEHSGEQTFADQKAQKVFLGKDATTATAAEELAHLKDARDGNYQDQLKAVHDQLQQARGLESQGDATQARAREENAWQNYLQIRARHEWQGQQAAAAVRGEGSVTAEPTPADLQAVAGKTTSGGGTYEQVWRQEFEALKQQDSWTAPERDFASRKKPGAESDTEAVTQARTQVDQLNQRMAYEALLNPRPWLEFDAQRLADAHRTTGDNAKAGDVDTALTRLRTAETFDTPARTLGETKIIPQEAFTDAMRKIEEQFGDFKIDRNRITLADAYDRYAEAMQGMGHSDLAHEAKLKAAEQRVEYYRKYEQAGVWPSIGGEDSMGAYAHALHELGMHDAADEVFLKRNIRMHREPLGENVDQAKLDADLQRLAELQRKQGKIAEAERTEAQIGKKQASLEDLNDALHNEKAFGINPALARGQAVLDVAPQLELIAHDALRNATSAESREAAATALLKLAEANAKIEKNMKPPLFQVELGSGRDPYKIKGLNEAHTDAIDALITLMRINERPVGLAGSKGGFTTPRDVLESLFQRLTGEGGYRHHFDASEEQVRGEQFGNFSRSRALTIDAAANQLQKVYGIEKRIADVMRSDADVEQKIMAAQAQKLLSEGKQKMAFAAHSIGDTEAWKQAVKAPYGELKTLTEGMQLLAQAEALLSRITDDFGNRKSRIGFPIG